MANYNSPRYRRIFAQLQTGGFRTVNNTSGTWTNALAKLVRVPENAVQMKPEMPKTEIPWLTGTRSRQPGILGRMGASWSLSNVPLIPSGAAGTAPDIDPILQNIFGQAPVIVGATSATYNFLDTGYLPLTLLDFPHGTATLTNRLIWGAFVTDFTITMNGNVLECSFNGVGGYLLDSDYYSLEGTVQKAGLTVAYPAEPGSPATAGNIIPGFGATVTVDSQVLETKVLSMTIHGSTGFRVIGNVMADAFGIAAVGGLRVMSTTIGFLDDDSTQLVDLKKQAKANANVAFAVTVGTVAGSKVVFTGSNLQLVPQNFNDQSDVVGADFPQSAFHASAVGVTDDLIIGFQ